MCFMCFILLKERSRDVRFVRESRLRMCAIKLS